MIATEHAPAKVNLTLHVTGRREDGYHLLDSLVIFTEFGDQVSASRTQGLSLALSGPEAGSLGVGPDNLVWQAARLVGAADLAILLDKQLPVASGIGGGSSDAAACLRLLARMSGKTLPSPQALLSLGADIPVCLSGRFSRMQGIGDILVLLPPCPEIWLVLVNPRIAVSTPSVFKALTHVENPPMPDVIPDWPDAGTLIDWLHFQRNDLQDPACVLVPEIARVLSVLQATSGCGLARMSGSGATCFGLFTCEADARLAATEIAQEYPQWWTVATARLAA